MAKKANINVRIEWSADEIAAAERIVGLIQLAGLDEDQQLMVLCAAAAIVATEDKAFIRLSDRLIQQLAFKLHQTALA